jgi:hypothetical protein
LVAIALAEAIANSRDISEHVVALGEAVGTRELDRARFVQRMRSSAPGRTTCS